MCKYVLSMAQEASELSELRPKLDTLGVPLYGILHEEKGSDEFNKYLKGELFFDKDVNCL